MIVIADDITGAAEIAGIAFARGAEVRLICDSVCGCDTATPSTGVTTVIATDTRSMSEGEALAETKRISAAFGSPEGKKAIFKKTDSALRGHVVAELTALMEVTGYERAVYLPANPSKGRIIRNGVYYIKEVRGEKQEIREVPLNETDFSFDPEFPARTSVLRERFPDAESKGIIMPDAESEEDIHNVISTYNDGKTIFAGAADLFSAMIGMGCGRLKESIAKLPIPIIPIHNSMLILCGSTQSKPLGLGIPIAPMPQEIYDGGDDLNLWDTTAYEQERHSLILTIPHTHRTGKEVAVHLRTMMAEMTKQLVTRHCPDHLVIEGGATAWATLQALGWTEFTITAQLAPGVVQMRVTNACHTQNLRSENGTLVTLKPGSYPWGTILSSYKA
jgi:uncharacterized protein YgbK (DUF1537 family)